MRGMVVAGLALLALATAPAAQADVTIGSSLAATPDGAFSCSGTGCTLSQASLTGRQVTAPAAGVVVRWRIRIGADLTGPVALQVIRRSGTGNAVGVEAGRSATVTPPLGATSAYPTRIPIAAGDYLGVACCTGGGERFIAGAAGAVDVWSPTLGGLARTPLDPSPVVGELLVNADVEPDADGDGFGDETQDGCPGDAGPANGCVESAPPPPPAAPRINTPPAVRFRTPLMGRAVAPSQAIELDVADDAGNPTVGVFDDDGTICTLSAPPYTCTWRPTGADVGRATLLASAVDSDGASTLGIVRVAVPRFKATLTKKVAGRRVTGTLRLPATVERSLGCRGEVTVRRGKVTRTAALKRNCTYSVRLPKGKGKVRTRFGGNPVIAPT